MQGQYHDEETGLYYNRYRYYDPGPGQFASQDPIGLLGGVNHYQYAPNSASWIDPLGLNPRYQEFLSRHGVDKAKGKLRTAWQQNNNAFQAAQQGVTFVLGDFDEATRYAHKIGGYALNLPGKDWDITVNDEWMRGGIEGRATYHLVSDPTDIRVMTHPKFGESVFARELRMLKDAGYNLRGVLGQADNPLRMEPPKINCG
jgi:RHS repeat-associated protein